MKEKEREHVCTGEITYKASNGCDTKLGFVLPVWVAQKIMGHVINWENIFLMTHAEHKSYQKEKELFLNPPLPDYCQCDQPDFYHGDNTTCKRCGRAFDPEMS